MKNTQNNSTCWERGYNFDTGHYCESCGGSLYIADNADGAIYDGNEYECHACGKHGAMTVYDDGEVCGCEFECEQTYTITADGKECFETDNESEAQEMLALLIAHQQAEPYCESSFQTVRNRQKVLHDLWRSEHPISEIWADTGVYHLHTNE